MSSSQNHTRCSLTNFFIYNTDYGCREGTEEEKVMLFIPQEEIMDRKVNAVGICQALAQFALTFDPSRSCECLITQKSKQYFLNSEGNFWMVMTLSIPSVDKVVKDRKVTEHFPDDVQDSVCEAVVQQAYDMFVLFNGYFKYISDRYGLPALKERLEFFYTRYLQTLNFGQLDLLDVYQGILYLPLDKGDFLRVQCFGNMIENTFPSVRHICVMHNEQLLWTTLSRKDMKIMYKYLTTSLFPASIDNEESDYSTVFKNAQQNINIPNPGRFLTAPIEMVMSANNLPKRAPRVFISVDGKVAELYLVVYKAYNSIVCLMVEQQMLNMDICSKLHNFIGPQLGSLSSIINEQGAKRNHASADQQYRFVYFNSMNLAIKSSIHAKRSSNVISVSTDIMRLLVDMHKDLKMNKSGGELVTKNLADCWIVGKRSAGREFFLILNQKNASLVEINDEVQRLIGSSFNNILFLD